MAMNLVTVEDLEKFKVEFLLELKALLESIEIAKPKRYLKSHEVMAEFQISATKLYEMRRKKEIPCMKVGGQYLYEYDELVKYFKRTR
jgi:hypothetical protein